MTKKAHKRILKDLKAVKRALEVFKSIERLDAIKTIVVKNNKNATLYFNIKGAWYEL